MTNSRDLIKRSWCSRTHFIDMWSHRNLMLIQLHDRTRQVTSRHVTSRHVTSRHVTSRHVTSHHVTSHHNTSQHVRSYEYIQPTNITTHLSALHIITFFVVNKLKCGKQWKWLVHKMTKMVYFFQENTNFILLLLLLLLQLQLLLLLLLQHLLNWLKFWCHQAWASRPDEGKDEAARSAFWHTSNNKKHQRFCFSNFTGTKPINWSTFA